jgi:hypothetical protein
MKPAPKNRMTTTAKALIDDLSAVRAAVLDKRQDAGAQERAVFEARLFESWVVDRLAQHECHVSAVREELADLREELAALRKSLEHPPKKARKETTQR